MKVLTIKQPWAGLILAHGKDIENRNWPTKLRGRIAIHSSARIDPGDLWDAHCLLDHPLLEHLARAGVRQFHGPGFQPGHILGTVEIVDCVTASESPWFFGPYGFVLRDPVLFKEPIPAKGKLGFWEWEPPEGV